MRGETAVAGTGTAPGGAPVYRLVQPEVAPLVRPRLDPTQQAVVDHAGGPLLVLAGPGTGKTTTIVEAVAARIEAGVDPERMLVLTFSRKAAAELRTRITARVGRTIREPVARTFHSYAFGVLRRAAVLRGEPAPRLLTSAEQDAVVADLLRGDVEEDGVRWPAELAAALGTDGFRDELRELLLRATERGVDAHRLAAWGRERGLPHWEAAAAFLRQYQDVSFFATVARGGASGYDPAELVRTAIDELRDDPQLLRGERERASWLFVDEYQDTDPAQVELLELLAGGGGDLVVVGDPDQAIYAFRGAEPRGIVEFPERFRHRDGRPAARASLGVCRRSGAELLAVSRRVAEGLPGPWEHRRLVIGEGIAPGSAEVHVFDSAAVEAAFVADTVRRAHLLDGVPWSEMAVVVRSAAASLGPVRRALSQAGVPVAVSADDVALAGQPAVQPLLAVMRALLPARGPAATGLAGPDADPDAVRTETGLDEPGAEALLASPLGGATVLDLRRMRRAVRRASAARGEDPATRSAPLAQLLTDATLLDAVPEHLARPAARVVRVLDAGRLALAGGGSAEDLLWALWQATGLGSRWARASAVGGQTGAVADRDLDAVVALFDAAAGFVDRLPHAEVSAFVDHLAAQQLPGDGGAARAPAGETVRLLTAHASKGLEWDLVCVAGVQEGVWPDLRTRASLLGAEDLMEAAAGTDPANLDRRTLALAEERRLFYVACTRARRRLVVSAVDGAVEGDAGTAVSRFLDLVVPPPADGEGADGLRRHTPLPRQLTLPALVAELRRHLTDPHTPAPRRASAAAVLRRLADERVPGADPAGWWGLAPLSDDAPLVDPADVVPVRPSAIDTFQRCPLRWVLGSVGAEAAPEATRTVGSAVHDVAQQVAEGLPPADAPAVLDAELDGLDLGPGWFDQRQRDRAQDMLTKFLAWHARADRELVAAEEDFDVVVGRARLRGQVDRLERDREGRLVVVDLKTGKTAPRSVEEHGQLAAYQVAVAEGAFAEHGTATGGAALLQVGGSQKAAKEHVQPALPANVDAGATWAGELLAAVGEGMGAGTFAVRTDADCDRCAFRRSCPMQEPGRQVTR
ncbi:Superfamily I DNA or RNA helicase [Modestobacter sp. DSM 44400]|uniref:ATP-dependent helicase n=1 Tax=Modestobacter sp. DSM 44400 TaxID=1550230 RepID=UPI000898B0EB|nr:ATP-dependent DNA helicase [Modestobacter sp. DSM 44400]SDX48167.1 Superfamily I DNA or RNA helicase [Modestobacter sp. DSM 44400]